MCFDTTASNMGKFTGACKLLEESLGQNLLWLACRYHMLEVLLSYVFIVCFGSSSGPEILIFKRFREKWTKLNHHEPKLQGIQLVTTPDELNSFIHYQLSEVHQCEDYKELLNLAGLHIGMNIECNIQKLGAIH